MRKARSAPTSGEGAPRLAMSIAIVLSPDPLSPTMEKNSPARTSNDTRSSASTSPSLAV